MIKLPPLFVLSFSSLTLFFFVQHCMLAMLPEFRRSRSGWDGFWGDGVGERRGGGNKQIETKQDQTQSGLREALV